MKFAAQTQLVMLQGPGQRALVRTAQVVVQLQGTQVRARGPTRLCAVARCCQTQQAHTMQHLKWATTRERGGDETSWYDVIGLDQIVRPVYLQPDPGEENHFFYKSLCEMNPAR